jgi:hypothetical protein
MKQDPLIQKARAHASKVVITSQCLSCGIHYTEPFQWYRDHEFNCPECSGPIDDTPILTYAQQAIERLKEARHHFPESNPN